MSGYVYLAHCPAKGELKIGFSRNPLERVRGLSATEGAAVELVGAISGSFQLEREFHKKFLKLRKHGEWFLDCVSIRDEFASSNRLPDRIIRPRAPSQHKTERLKTLENRAFDAGLSMSEICARAKVAQSTVSRWRANPQTMTSKPYHRLMIAIAEIEGKK